MRVAFLNERSWALAEKLGWSSHFLTTAFQLPLRPERLPSLQTMAKETPGLGAGAQVAGGAVRTVGRAIAMTAIDLDVLPASRETIAPFTLGARSDALCASKSADFLNWRVLSHPHADRYLVLKSASVQAIARILSHAGCRRLHLLTLLAQPGDRRGLSRFFGGVVRWALSSDVDTILLVTSVPEIARVAGRWLPVKSRQRFAFDAEDAAGRAFLGDAIQDWELIDSDFEMMFESEA